MGPRPLGPRKMDGLLVPPGKAADHLNTGEPLKSKPAQEKWFSQIQSNHPYTCLIGLPGWFYL